MWAAASSIHISTVVHSVKIVRTGALWRQVGSETNGLAYRGVPRP